MVGIDPLTLLVVAAALVNAASGQSPPPPPRLVVVIVVDQMRADYVERFRGDWTAGLKRLVAEGAWFSNAAYPYLGTYTCAGHATIATGAFPHLHGIMQNNWWDRSARRTIACTDDHDVTTLRYPSGTDPGASAARLLLPTLADELRAQRSARAWRRSRSRREARSCSPATAAMPSPGWTRTTRSWQTSTAYTPQRVPAVKAFLAANPVDADFGKSWTAVCRSNDIRR